ncbi:M48 family metallopeptidase [Telmatospirillum sp. J64-1]|uniref:M48 family metallopeptidase n=1 Tax=Telmatospirillum sp. J64-1 TaxID=2502183 RepID=UPI00115E1B0E|nr:M48 family metallopeptidase [Telmatospirillum sp. J64-1]
MPVDQRPAKQGGRPVFRHAAAAVVLGGGLLISGCAPTGTGIGLNLVPEEQVQEMGLEAWQQIRSETPVSNNRQYQQTAQRVATRLLQAADRDPSNWEVVVFQGQEANAFALPGGKIGVYEGMMQIVGSDDELAAVIGHEIAHNERDHASQRVSSQMATQMGADLAASALGAAGFGNPQIVAGVLGAGAQYGLILPYSRNQELEADRLGLQYMAQAGYNPQAAITFWQKMEQQGGRPPEFLSTHPAPGQRIQQLQAMMPEAMEIYRAATGS